MKKILCKSCNKSFVVPAHRERTAKFCSMVCVRSMPNYGKMITGGYLYVLNPEHHLANKRGYVKNSFVVIENKIGREIGKGEIVDHINRNKLDDRPENLRIANKMQNAINSKIPSTNTSGYKGVSFYGRDKNWESYIKYKQKRIFLGRYKTKNEAAIKYNL